MRRQNTLFIINYGIKKYWQHALLLCSLLVYNVTIAQNPVSNSTRPLNISVTVNDTNQVNYFNELSFFYIQTNTDSVFLLAEMAKDLSEKLGYVKGTAEARINISRYYQNKGSYSLAMENCLAALKAFETLDLPSSIANAYLLLANISKDMSGQHRTVQYTDNGIVYARSSYNIYVKQEDTSGMVASLITRGILFRDKAIRMKMPMYFDSAFSNYKDALKLIEFFKTAHKQLPRLYNNISQIFIEHKKDYKTALEYLFKAVRLNEAGNNQSSLTFNYGNISNAYIQVHDYPNALKYSTYMLQLTRQMGQPSRIQNALHQMYQVYRAKGQFDSALNYFILADNVNDSITDIEKTSQVMELQTRYETNKKELMIQQLNLEDANKSRRIALLALATLILVIVSVWMILLYRRVNKQKSLISMQTTRLEVMLKELHHRVKNNLQIVGSLLSLQSYKLEDEATISVLRESEQRVQAMSLIHQTLYKTENITSVNMKQYVLTLVETLLAAYGYRKENFDLEIRIEKEILDVDKALPIGLIMNELVTNCMKYAYRDVSHPLLKIELLHRNGNLELSIKDNGPGLDEKMWKHKSTSFGKQLIAALSKQLRATQTILVNQGTHFTISMPA